MKKALAELEARLPIKFSVNQEVERRVEVRKWKRYEMLKTKDQALEFMPEGWDYPRDANVALPKLQSDQQ